MGMMKTPAIALTLVLSLTACAGEAASPPQASTPPDSPVSSGPLPDDKIAPPAAPSPVQQRDGLLDPHPVSWSDPVVGADEHTVTVSWWSGPEECYGLARTKVSYSSKHVGIDVYEGRVPGTDVCPEIAMWKATTIELTEPVGGRDIVPLTIID